MNPYLWLMCNDVEKGWRLPPLMSLKAIDPSETSMEVVLVDRRGDSRLKELEDKAQELYCASENTLMLVEKLGKLVAIYMGGTFPVEQGDIHMCWKLVSERLREFQQCIVLPIGSLSIGLCRHRAILFKVMECTMQRSYQLAGLKVEVMQANHCSEYFLLKILLADKLLRRKQNIAGRLTNRGQRDGGWRKTRCRAPQKSLLCF
ncbi:serine/threonine-protein kinase CTR1-like [Carya illinoinensis]|uniref:serine/threonine-protein kinase CTR1-like n=1 Tax=Carya illinoinensis TaxID=32201 RepID=UPI001C726E71|nr:serine/threonine-protein kinase CTR1-like [Carya illinoinensis]